MKLHEYQAKQIFASFGIPTPRGAALTTSTQAAIAFEALKKQCGGKVDFACNVKAQLHAGGRAKAGGVLLAHSAQQASSQAGVLLNKRLVTKQTGPDGLLVSVVLLEERIPVRNELYIAVTIDRFKAKPVILSSSRGGVDIEEVAVSTPEAILREVFDVDAGPSAMQLARVAANLECSNELASSCIQITHALWSIFESNDASLVEINPLVVSDDGKFVALDAKITIDDNALFRHPDIAALRDESQEQPLELNASKIGISYVGLDGDIGCLVNGAGLAMATNDIIKLCGGSPANFLDVGGGANVEQVTNAFSIILADHRVKIILVNIFGGIMRCDWIAQGLLNATKELDMNVPIVVRLEGTNVEEGRQLLRQAKQLKIISVDNLEEAARQAVKLAQCHSGLGVGGSGQLPRSPNTEPRTM